jgi:hypothetical protein
MSVEGWISGNYYFWKKNSHIFKIKFEDNAQVEEVIESADITDWLPVSDNVVATIDDETVLITPDESTVISSENMEIQNAVDIQSSEDAQ